MNELQENYIERRSGLIVPLSTLPGDDHRGTFGPEYIEFLQIMKNAGFDVLHDLPGNPPDEYNCPYSSVSAFAIDPQRIYLVTLAEAGDITKNDLNTYQKLVSSCDAGPAIKSEKEMLLRRAFINFDNNGSSERKLAFETWRAEEADWLDSYTAFEILKMLPQNQGKPWKKWETGKDYSLKLVDDLKASNGNEFSEIAYMQWIAEEQTLHYRQVAKHLGVETWGDVPFYVGSGEIWANRPIFNLDSDGNQLDQGGAAPSLTSETGQMWGNATYNLDNPEATIKWWVRRLQRAIKLNPDNVRLDHFIGMIEPWIIAIDARDGKGGHRAIGIGYMLLAELVRIFGPDIPFYPEDLGTQTEATARLRDAFGLLASKLSVRPLAKELSDNNPQVYRDAPNNPDNYWKQRTVGFTGNHDTPTLIQAFNDIRNNNDPGAWDRYLNHVNHVLPGSNLNRQTSSAELAQREIERVIRSMAQYAFLPLGDLFGLGEEGQFNKPGTANATNWTWRMSQTNVQMFNGEVPKWRELNRSSNRLQRVTNKNPELITGISDNNPRSPRLPNILHSVSALNG